MIRRGWIVGIALMVGAAFIFDGCAAPRAVVGVTKGVVKGTGKAVKKTTKVVTKPLR